MKKVLFVCSGGMSSAIVEKALQDEAKKAGVEIKSTAMAADQAEDTINQGDWDIVLVAPQVRNKFNIIKKMTDANGIRIASIPPRDYSPLGGKHVLDLVLNDTKN